MAALCENCKRNGRVWCPHNAALEMQARMKGLVRQEMSGAAAQSFFVGHNFYPNVYWGPVVSPERAEDDPAKMYGMPLEKIIENRAMMVRGTKRSAGGVKFANSGSREGGGRILEEAQNAVMSVKVVDAEARFTKTPVFSFEFDSVIRPVGASAPIEKFRLTENAPVPKKVDSFYNSDEVANDALRELLLSGFDVHYLSRLLSSGILGRRKDRKLVPTKWAITATDDMAAKRFMESVRDCRELEEARVYSNSYLDNHFEILLLPGNWEYEQFETGLTRELEERQKKKQSREGLNYSVSAWEDWKNDGRVNISEEHEPFFGRSDYAQRQGGGYYAARLAACEALYRMNRQARVVVFREIGTGYDVPVGVWEVRENVRHAFLSAPEKFATQKEAMARLSEKLAVPMGEYVKNSKILAQRRLTDY